MLNTGAGVGARIRARVRAVPPLKAAPGGSGSATLLIGTTKNLFQE